MDSQPIKDRNLLNQMHKSKLLQALELMELAISIMRQNIIRKMPGASQIEINLALQAWIDKRPGL